MEQHRLCSSLWLVNSWTQSFKEYLAGSLAHRQKWWWGCWTRHRSEQIGLPSPKSWCPNSLKTEILKYSRKNRKAHWELWQSCSLRTRGHFGLITHNADSASVHPRKSHHNVSGIVRHDLEKVPLVHNLNRQNWHICSNFPRLDDSCEVAQVPRERCPTCRTLLLTRKGRWCPTNGPGDHWQKKKVEMSLRWKKRTQTRWRWWVTWGHGTPWWGRGPDCLTAGS